jgi:hypothetical protein
MSARRIAVLAAVAACLSSVACLDEAPSLHPLFTTSLRVPEIEGRWVSSEGEPLQFVKAADGYELTLPGWDLQIPGEKERAVLKAKVRFGRLSDQLFADFTAIDQTGDADGASIIALWPVHVFARVSVSPGQLEIARLDSAWFIKAIRSRQIQVRHEVMSDEDVVVTASTAQLQRIFAEYAYHPEMFETPTVFTRP